MIYYIMLYYTNIDALNKTLYNIRSVLDIIEPIYISNPCISTMPPIKQDYV